VEPLQQLFGEGVYVHQFKINARRRSGGVSVAPGRHLGARRRQPGARDGISIFLDECCRSTAR
jgi:hypothetical protein